MLYHVRLLCMPIHIKHQKTSKNLVILFPDIARKMNLPLEDFLKASELETHSIIIVDDNSRRMGLAGMPPEADAFEGLLQWLGKKIELAAPEKLIVTGHSMGGFAALLYGHFLKADLVVSFAPYTYLSRSLGIKLKDPELQERKTSLNRLETIPIQLHALFDLKQILSNWNQHTDYYINVSRYHYVDYKRALYLKESPNVHIVPQPYNSHAVIRYLAKDNRLNECFLAPGKRYIKFLPHIRRLARENIEAARQKVLRSKLAQAITSSTAAQ